MFRFSWISLALVGLMAGCAAREASIAPEYGTRDEARGSLFGADQAVLNDNEIARALNSRVAVPDKIRIAVLRMDDPQSWRWWSEDLSRLEAGGVEGMLTKLRASDRVWDASVLPAMLMPPMRTVPQLRVAAARFQADMVLVYEVKGRTYQRQEFLQSEEAKAQCLVEAVLIDTRSGLVPFAGSKMQSYTVKKSKDDFSSAEIAAKAQLQATSVALEQIADEVVAFLKAMPAADNPPPREG